MSVYKDYRRLPPEERRRLIRQALDRRIDERIAAAEPLVESGKRVSRGGRLGHEKRWGTEEEKRKRWADWQRWIDEQHGSHPKLSYNALTKAAEKHFEVSQRTIKKHTKAPASS